MTQAFEPMAKIDNKKKKGKVVEEEVVVEEKKKVNSSSPKKEKKTKKVKEVEEKTEMEGAEAVNGEKKTKKKEKKEKKGKGKGEMEGVESTNGEKTKKKKEKKKKEDEKEEEGEEKAEMEGVESTNGEEKGKQKTSKKERKESLKMEKKKKKEEKKRKRESSAAEQVEDSSKKAKLNDGSAIETVDPVEWRKEQSITVKGSDAAPLTSFDMCQSKFPRNLVKYCTDNFDKPSPIQAQCWPIALDGRDLVAIAETGSGKTLAFLMPALAHLRERMNSGFKMTNSKKALPSVLILAPTRELALQIHSVAQILAKIIGLRTACIYGGAPKYAQKRALQFGVHLLVATTGRLLDFLQEGCTTLENVSFVVLDEADRMLDQGFEPDLRAILPQVTMKHRTMMFSATWPVEIKKLAKSFLEEPAKIMVGSAELSANPNVKQIIEVVKPDQRTTRVVEVIKEYQPSKTNKILIFVEMKRECQPLVQDLKMAGIRAVAIHGDADQRQREYALNNFKTGRTPVLVATNVAARGLDIPKVEYVINHSFPRELEDYVHRIGRTGRAGLTGISHTFFCEEQDAKKAFALVKILKEANQEIPEDLQEIATRRSGGRDRRNGFGGGGRNGFGGRGRRTFHDGFGRGRGGGGFRGRQFGGGFKDGQSRGGSRGGFRGRSRGGFNSEGLL